MDNWINLLPVLILAAACFYILLTDYWLHSFLGYAVVYLSAFCILVQYWSFTLSLIKLLTGLITLTVLGISIYRQTYSQGNRYKSELVFRVAALILIFIMMMFIAGRISIYLSLPEEITISSLFIIGFSFFQLGITQDPLKIFLSILLLFFGFEMIFSSNESSLLVNGLLALISLLLALTGSYMIVNEFEGGEE